MGAVRREVQSIKWLHALSRLLTQIQFTLKRLGCEVARMLAHPGHRFLFGQIIGLNVAPNDLTNSPAYD